MSYFFVRLRVKIFRRLINWMIPLCGWRNAQTILDTEWPNVNCLRVIRLEAVNQYGQIHVWERGE